MMLASGTRELSGLARFSPSSATLVTALFGSSEEFPLRVLLVFLPEVFGLSVLLSCSNVASQPHKT